MSEATITYRKLDPDDVEQFKSLRIEASGDSPVSFLPDIEELRQTSTSDFKKQIASSDFQAVYGAFGNAELVGIAGVRRDAMNKVRHRATVWGVYTKEPHRGQGIARELMRLLLNDVRSGGKISILYLSVDSQNAAAKALYRSIGFESYGLQRRAMLVDGEYVDLELMDLPINQAP